MRSACRGVAWALVLASSWSLLTSRQTAGSEIPGSNYAAAIRADDDASGFAAFPARFSTEQKPVEILDPAGFRLHMTKTSDPGDELVYPAGELIDPPLGRFRIWLQGEWTMTPFSQLVGFGTKREPGLKSLQAIPIVPAGRVTVDPEQAFASHLQLRLLYLEEDPSGLLRHELTRRRTLAEVGDGLLMPQGRVLAAIWDSGEERYVALSRPFAVRTEETVPAPLERPKPGSAHLVVYVDRPAAAVTSSLRRLSLTVRQRDETRPPDLQVTTPWGSYNIWYDLPPGGAVLAGGNEKLVLAAERLTLADGQVGQFKGTLAKRLP